MIDPLFDSRPPELTSDLEWMLQSGQATHEMLAEALVQEFYQDAYRIAMVFLDNPLAVRSLLLEVFSYALLNVYRYRSQIGARAWFFRMLTKALRNEIPRFSFKQSVDSQTALDPAADRSVLSPMFKAEESILAAFEGLVVHQRLALYFRIVLDWPVEEIALAMGTDSTKVDRWLIKAYQRISQHAGPIRWQIYRAKNRRHGVSYCNAPSTNIGRWSRWIPMRVPGSSHRF